MDRMDEIKKTLSNDAKVTDIMKILAKQWKSLPPLEKQKYEDYAQVDKSRYFNEMSHYSGPMQVPNKRQKKPPGAPKRAMSAFLSYSQVMRPTIRAQQPNLKNSDISSVLASQWRTASNEEKQPHIEKELKDRENNSSNSTISSTNNKIKSSLTSGPLHRSHNHIQQPANYGGDSRPNVTEAESKSYDMSMYNPYDYMIPYTDQYYINPSNRSNTINKSKIYDKTNDNLEKSKSVRFNNDSMSKLLTTKKTQKNITNGLSNNSNNSSIYIKKQIKPKKSSPVERSAEELEKDSDYSKVIRTLKAIKQAHMSGYSDDSNSSIDDDKK
eukprot:gene22209-28758_t